MTKKITIYLIIFAALAATAYWYSKNYYSVDTIPMIWATTTGNEFRARVIKRYGIDKKYRINLENRFYNPGDLERRINDQEVDTGIYGLINLERAAKEGKKLVVYVADLHANQFIVVRKDSRIKTLEDLRGKKIGMQPRGAAGYVTVGTLLKEFGMDIERDFRLLFGSNKDLADFLIKGEVDATLAAYPALTSLMATGNYRVLFRVEDLWREKFNRDLPFVVIVAHDDWLKKNKDLARRITKMWHEGGKFIQQRPEVLLEETETLERLGIKTEEAKRLLIASLPQDLYTEWNASIAADAKFLLEKAVAAGFFPPIPLDDLFAIL